MADLDELAVVVLDIGSGWSKAGFAGDEAPRSVFRTVVGQPRFPGIMVGMDEADSYVGQQAVSKRGLLNIRHPIVKRQIADNTDLEKIWHHAFYSELKAVPEEHPVLISEAPNTPKAKREEVMELMFENLTVPAYFSAVQATLGLYASGKTIGLVVDSGEGATDTVPVYEGYCCQHAINDLSIAGAEVTSYLRQLLEERGYSMTTPNEIEMVRDIKERMGYVPNDQEGKDDSYSTDTTYQMPDGNTIFVTGERCRAPEALFNPALFGSSEDGLHHKVYQSIMKCDQDIRKDMYDNIILVGGNTLFPGLKDRLRLEVQHLAPVGTRPKVIDPPERQYSVWVGGSILASLSTFQRMWISKAEYDEHGTSIIHIKS
jgi:actin beta/gamma 1